MGVDEEFGVFWCFNETKMGVEEVGEEKSEVLNELLVLVIGRGIGAGHV